MNQENKYIYISTWLMLITLLVVIMIIVGGLTRLTDSGLSITRWDLITGIIPPLNLDQWQISFELYKKIPEFKLINPTMTLEEFKTIYYWEYIHRLLGRILGIAFLLPLIFFTFKKKITKKYLFSFYFIFFLILLQGAIGWYMVKSGLVKVTDVSHYRLSLHLTLAFIIFIFLLWNFLSYTNKSDLSKLKKIPYNLPKLFLFFILLQVSIGAFVSGLDAGQIYQTWPLMNDTYFPNDSNVTDLFKKNVFSIPSLVQFIHRNIAYFILFLFIFIFLIVFKTKDLFYLRNTVILIFISLVLQIFLGILTILSGAQLLVSSLHQVGSIFLVSTSLILVFKNSNLTNSS